MIEEVQVVHGHDADGPPRRNGDRVHRMDDVLGAGEPFDRRESKPVPAQVQHAHGNARVHDLRTRHDPGGEAILPGAGEQREDVGRPEQRRQRGGELVRVLADAGALAKGGPVIDEDAHSRAIVAQDIGVLTPYTSIN